MSVLNSVLYDRLREAFGHVRVTNNGQVPQLRYKPDYFHRSGRPKAAYSSWGETYFVNCPFCSDTRRRLCISHLWGVRDARTRDDMIQLVKCFNEDCLNTRESQKKLHAMVFPGGRFADQIDPKDLPIKPTSVAPPPVSIVMPKGTRLDQLEEGCSAWTYLRRRGFDPHQLGRDYGVEHCDGDSDSKPALRHERFVIPIYQPAPVSLGKRRGTPPRLRLAGWQARLYMSNPPDDVPKYLTAAGTPKSQILYGLPYAINTTGPVVIVEGITDAWKVGRNAVAILGKHLSDAQCKLVLRHFHDRPVVVWLDPDASEQAQSIRGTIRRARVNAGDPSPVLLAVTPAERADPGECTPEECRIVVESALTQCRGSVIPVGLEFASGRQGLR
jgi:hypothetical protein